jgi:hypothetical protein
MSSSGLENNGGHIQPEGGRYTRTTGTVQPEHPAKLTQPSAKKQEVIDWPILMKPGIHKTS